ncbi:MAG: calcium-binding protein [Firmicutes bacterium]|nr:calcium-binding protein [Bacillota bacterium]
MEYSKETLSNMEFNDEFTRDECEENEEVICSVCGSNSDILIGYNKNEQLFRYECTNCGAVVVEGNEDSILVKGEERDWEKYLSETLEFPFVAQIIETSDREFFNPEDPGPICFLDIVEVTEVFETSKYGIIVVIKKDREKHAKPIFYIEAVDYESQNYVEIENYKRWRDNYWSSDYLMNLLSAFNDS